jgi:hypothetical protein
MLSKCRKKAVKKTKGKEASPLRERERVLHSLLV